MFSTKNKNFPCFLPQYHPRYEEASIYISYTMERILGRQVGIRSGDSTLPELRTLQVLAKQESLDLVSD